MSARVLVYGYGNPGRIDDGLGPALADELATRAIDGVSVETAYQLQIEDAALIAAYDAVVFADADKSCPPPFELRAIEPRASTSFSTHSVAPESVLALARDHFQSDVTGFVLGIRGEEFDEYDERLSDRAREHLSAAADHLEAVLREGSLPEGAAPAGHESEAQR